MMSLMENRVLVVSWELTADGAVFWIPLVSVVLSPEAFSETFVSSTAISIVNNLKVFSVAANTAVLKCVKSQGRGMFTPHSVFTFGIFDFGFVSGFMHSIFLRSVPKLYTLKTFQQRENICNILVCLAFKHEIQMDNWHVLVKFCLNQRF